MLELSHGHSMWYMEWGNKQAAVPVIVLHGGPGSESKESAKAIFDPAVHRVIFYDQRGCGKSKPSADLAHNTTDLLIEDLEALRLHLKEDNVMLAGGSWGSTLALLYAIMHPKNVKRMLLNGIFLGTKQEYNYSRQGLIKTHFPEAWGQYVEIVPESQKDDTVTYYYHKFLNAKGKELNEHVKRWTLLESAAASIDGDYFKDELATDGGDEKNHQMATIEAHYFAHDSFLPDNYIMEHLSNLKKIPIVLVQGRHDLVCPAENAYWLAKKLGNKCHLHMTPGSHKKEMALREVVRAYAWAFLGKDDN